MTYWGIMGRNGRIRVEIRRREGTEVWSTGGASGDQEIETLAALHYTKSEKDVFTGPLWQRKIDAKAVCRPGEKPVRVKVVPA